MAVPPPRLPSGASEHSPLRMLEGAAAGAALGAVFGMALPWLFGLAVVGGLLGAHPIMPPEPHNPPRRRP